MVQVTLTVSTINIAVELEQQPTINILTDVDNAITNQVLTKDGNGNATFQTLPTGGSGSVSFPISIPSGGTGQITQQAAINALTNVSATQDEYVLTKDTSTGNAIWKPSQGGGGGSGSVVSSFTYASLSSGTLTIQHNLDQKYVDVTIYNEDDIIVNPDYKQMIDNNNLLVSLVSYGQIQGTWHIKITP